MSMIADFSHVLSQQGIVFAFSGSLSTDLITSILHLLDNRLKLDGVGIRRKKNIINIAIECLQNIHYHGFHLAEEADHLSQCMVALQKTDVGYCLWFQNLVAESEAESLVNRINYLNQLSPDDLHTEYLNVLNRGIITPKGGGGLGLIRILREAGCPLTYQIDPGPAPGVFALNLLITLQVEQSVTV